MGFPPVLGAFEAPPPNFGGGLVSPPISEEFWGRSPPPPFLWGFRVPPSPISVALWVLPTFSWGFGDPSFWGPPQFLRGFGVPPYLWIPKPISEGLPPPLPPISMGFWGPPPHYYKYLGGVFAPPSPSQSLWGLPTPERIWGPADLFTPFPLHCGVGGEGGGGGADPLPKI